VLIDACEDSLEWFSKMEKEKQLPNYLRWEYCPRNSEDVSGPGRSSILRNYGVKTCKTDWISFLDDDNEFESNHIETLLEVAQKSQVLAVHSHLKMFYLDGTPFTEAKDPWCQDWAESNLVYQKMLRQKVRTENSNIFRDRLDPIDCADPVRSVDTGEWFLARQLLLAIPFEAHYTQADWERMTGEDDKLNKCLVENKIAVACTHRATLRYYLGGYSNTKILI
jgi:glycosyltransferase involved in cell wall biosynthesis